MFRLVDLQNQFIIESAIEQVEPTSGSIGLGGSMLMSMSISFFFFLHFYFILSDEMILFLYE